VVWSAEFLPYDTQRLIAVPGPIGGALALSTNSLLYLNQVSFPYRLILPAHGADVSITSHHDTQASASCLPLNVFADLYLSPQTPFPSAGKNRVGIALDAARDVFLADDQLLVSLKGGELYAWPTPRPMRYFSSTQLSVVCRVSWVVHRYIFHLLSDGRTVNDIQLTKAGSSVITSCVRALASAHTARRRD
jgi:cleavage and polyadenylation specificity factor subunit 1